MQIGTLAQLTGLSRDTLRFYEKLGLISSSRGANRYRTYAPDTVRLLGYIRMAQGLGFTLGEIGESLPALWNSSMPGDEIDALLVEKVAAIDRKIAALYSLKQQLLDTIARDH